MQIFENFVRTYFREFRECRVFFCLNLLFFTHSRKRAWYNTTITSWWKTAQGVPCLSYWQLLFPSLGQLLSTSTIKRITNSWTSTNNFNIQSRYVRGWGETPLSGIALILVCYFLYSVIEFVVETLTAPIGLFSSCTRFRPAASAFIWPCLLAEGLITYLEERTGIWDF